MRPGYIAQTIPGETTLRIRDYAFPEMRLAITLFFVALAFLGVSSAYLGHFEFQKACLAFLLKSYFLTFLYAVAGLLLIAVVVHLIRKENDHELVQRYKLISFFVPTMMLINLIYFTLKAGSVAFNPNHHLVLHERVLWELLRPLFSNIPGSGYRFLDFCYTTVWFASLSALPLSLIIMKPGQAARLNSAVMLLLAFTALGNVFLLTPSPIYELPKYFLYLPPALSSWKIHHASFALSRDLVNMKATLFSERTAGFFQPVAAFPAFHSAYAFLLFLVSWKKKYLRYLGMVFWMLIVLGGLVLGYHGFVGTTVAVIVAGAMFCSMAYPTPTV